MKLSEKVAIVTGAGQAIGLEICRKLAKAGAHIILNDLDSRLANDAASSISEDQGKCIPVPGDSSDPEVINQLVEAAVFNFGKLHIAIANAGITLFGDFFEYSRDAFDRVMKVNLAGTFFPGPGRGKANAQAGNRWKLIIHFIGNWPPGAQGSWRLWNEQGSHRDAGP